MHRTMEINPEELLFHNVSRVRLLGWYAFTVSVMITLMRLWYHALSRDPLAMPLVVGEYVSIDLWSFVHVAIYTGIGFVMPDQFLVTLLGGVVFEFVEGHLSDTPITELHTFWEERGVNSVWDIFFNTVGFRLGQVLLVLYVQSNRSRSASMQKKAK
eukprot:TRINITY_DN74776_c0_g1_i1.p1 TRINITY_DN74776_c0_g1~~TRINITY_DN74776_c0_g1_i1.p1  ORF type:complete len:157 (+),score=65.79 TRINITY_DN74776_c0_g1_i1:167-637(+)